MAYIGSSAPSRPVALPSSSLARVYGLFALAMAITAGGTFAGMTFAQAIAFSGWMYILLFAGLGIVLTSGMWIHRSPLNYVLFCAFPFIAGLSIAPLLFVTLTQYTNGPAILFNAVVSTAFLAAGASVFAATTSIDLGFLGRFLMMALFGLIGFALLQIFFPGLRGGNAEILFSGAGVVIFALFTAYDVQRIQQQARFGAHPFQLALSLYLDIFNLFLYVLRFMLALYGSRR